MHSLLPCQRDRGSICRQMRLWRGCTRPLGPSSRFERLLQSVISPSWALCALHCPIHRCPPNLERLGLFHLRCAPAIASPPMGTHDQPKSRTALEIRKRSPTSGAISRRQIHQPLRVHSKSDSKSVLLAQNQTGADTGNVSGRQRMVRCAFGCLSAPYLTALVKSSCKAIARDWTVRERRGMPFGPSSVTRPFSPVGTHCATSSVLISSSKVTRPVLASEREVLAPGLELQCGPESSL
jgi:hypothetical protein